VRDVADVTVHLGELPPVNCNIGDINQAVLNLVVNAAQAIGANVAGTAQRGQLTVTTRCEQEEVIIEVGDTGGGIPPEIADRVFEPFFTTKEIGVGYGSGAFDHVFAHSRRARRHTFL